MIRLTKILTWLGISIVAGFIFAVFIGFLSPRYSFLGVFASARDMALSVTNIEQRVEMTISQRAMLAAVMFAAFAFIVDVAVKYYGTRIEKFYYTKKETHFFVRFVERLRFSYSFENLVDAIQQVLELQADCPTLFCNTASKEVLYSSDAPIFSSDVMQQLVFSDDEDIGDGVYFFSDTFAVMRKHKTARGFFVVSGEERLFVSCQFLKDVQVEIFDTLFEELRSFQKRQSTLTTLLHYSDLAQEWSMVADTQQSFLPKKIPELNNLEVGVIFRPLINVAGDFYDVIPLDEKKTLLVVGDVSGKGLAAALVMGVVVNTIKVAENKTDLAGLILAIDVAIKRMKLQDKYTALFLGLMDLETMHLSYVNASMSDPLILTPSPSGYKIKTLESTCSIIGIIDLENVREVTVPLFRGDVLLIVSDGVTEVANADGVELGDTDYYLDSLKSFVNLPAQKVADSVIDLAVDFNAAENLRDDVTIMIAKIEE